MHASADTVQVRVQCPSHRTIMMDVSPVSARNQIHPRITRINEEEREREPGECRATSLHVPRLVWGTNPFTERKGLVIAIPVSF